MTLQTYKQAKYDINATKCVPLGEKNLTTVIIIQNDFITQKLTL